ncbi:MAG: hypothetical protein M0T75_06100 [Chloroflexi bacterium]|nr:hypothetical protein [Chloroflexota bacterium]
MSARSTEQQRGGMHRAVLALVAGTAGLAVLALAAIALGPRTLPPAQPPPLASASAGPSPTSPPTPTVVPTPTNAAALSYGWYRFESVQEGSHVEGPQDPLGLVHLRIRTGVALQVTADFEKVVDPPRPQLELNAAPFATAADGAMVYGYTLVEGAVIRQVSIADGAETPVATIPAAVPQAVLDRSRGLLFYARFGLEDRRYQGIWELDLAGGSERRLLGPSGGIKAEAGAQVRVKLFLTPDRDRLVAVECPTIGTCVVRVWELDGGRPGITVRDMPPDDVAGLTDSEIVVGNRRVNLDTGAMTTTLTCFLPGTVVRTQDGAALIYVADGPWSSCPGGPYRLDALDLSTGVVRTVWSAGDTTATPTLQLVSPDAGLGLELPPSTFLVSPDGLVPPTEASNLVSLPAP